MGDLSHGRRSADRRLIKSGQINFPIAWEGRKSVRAKRVDLRPRGLTWVMSVMRKCDKVFGGL